MFPTIENFNLFFFPTLSLIVAALLKEEKLVEFLTKKRGKNNEIKYH